MLPFHTRPSPGGLGAPGGRRHGRPASTRPTRRPGRSGDRSRNCRRSIRPRTRASAARVWGMASCLSCTTPLRHGMRQCMGGFMKGAPSGMGSRPPGTARLQRGTCQIGRPATRRQTRRLEAATPALTAACSAPRSSRSSLTSTARGPSPSRNLMSTARGLMRTARPASPRALHLAVGLLVAVSAAAVGLLSHPALTLPADHLHRPTAGRRAQSPEHGQTLPRPGAARRVTRCKASRKRKGESVTILALRGREG